MDACGCKEALNIALNCVLNGQWGDLSSFGLFFLIVTTMFLRLLAEALGWVANKTKATWDNQLVHKIMDTVNFLAKAIGFFGAGSPRMTKGKTK